MQRFSSNGKLLITGEYLVLDGALALAVPTKFGQTLTAEFSADTSIQWQSFNHKSDIWYSNTFNVEKGGFSSLAKDETSHRLLSIFKTIQMLNQDVFSQQSGFKFTTNMDFPNNWGLGSSSTLITNLANWAQIDPYLLLEKTFGGSGYDIACAINGSPITYQLSEQRLVEKVGFNPDFKDHLFFVFLNKKQNSREAITYYKTEGSISNSIIEDINAITTKIITCTALKDFETLLTKHETILSEVLKTPTIKQQLFPDYEGMIKSLGAWGGDFVLASGTNSNKNYFKNKGYNTIIDYVDMVLP